MKFITLVQVWVGHKLPPEHIWVKPEQRPRGLYKNLRMYFRKWIIHPIRRHKTYYYSRKLQKNGCAIIGITGSAGKTTTKEMIGSILSRKYKTVWSPANIDPVYNIPTTVLGAQDDTQKLILEMGIEFPGELDFYTWLAKPNIGVLTSVDWTHTEFFGDVDGVLREKQKLITSLDKNGYAVLNYDDERVRSVATKTKANVVFYGSSDNCDVRFSDVRLTKDFRTELTLSWKKESIRISLPLLGYHFASLAAAAASCALISGLRLKDIKEGLEKMENQPHRMYPIRLKNGSVVLDDTYNANPFATKGALRILKGVSKGKRKIFVFGEMKELGDYAIKGHSEIGKEIVKTEVSYLLTIGELTKHTIKSAIKEGMPSKNTYLAKNKEELLQKLTNVMKKDDVVLIKASRSMGLEEVVASLS